MILIIVLIYCSISENIGIFFVGSITNLLVQLTLRKEKAFSLCLVIFVCDLKDKIEET